MVSSNDSGNNYNLTLSDVKCPKYVWTVSIYGNLEHICSSEDKAKKLQKALFDAEFEDDIIIEGDLDYIDDAVPIEKVKLDE